MTLLMAATAVQFAVPAVWAPLTPFPVLAATVATSGFLLMIRAWWLFKVKKTAICPTAKTTTLITTDIYKWTRNPMYLGIVFMLLGIGLLTGSVFHYLAAMTFFAIIDYSFCPYEENKLRMAFGDDFTRYTNRVRRWL
jgi:protein-S-isoprenylcysteine O-methyltransferase Ste14